MKRFHLSDLSDEQIGLGMFVLMVGGIALIMGTAFHFDAKDREKFNALLNECNSSLTERVNFKLSENEQIKNFNLKMVEVKNPQNQNAFVVFKGTTEVEGQDGFKFINVDYEINKTLADDLQINPKITLFTDKSLDYVKKLIDIVENEEINGIALTDYSMSEDAEKTLRTTMQNNKNYVSYKGDRVYLNLEENTPASTSGGRHKIENQLLYISQPKVNQEDNTVSFEAEVLIKQYYESYNGEGAYNWNQDLTVLKKQTYSMPITEELTNNPNLIFSKVVEAKQNDNAENLKLDVYIKKVTVLKDKLAKVNAGDEEIKENDSVNTL